ncbi:coniferyl alcohol acyltransferase-like [Diospyros lotus]|uniref:coniferyl alcohol acyltransferase-like n=1 Tax=Diospyros lotus TaxID=55363 RepID=UPI002251720A|nr:coniferyl alcohol acyltransferase-like [Diospyros lotus]
MGGKAEFTVEVRRKEVVAAALPMQEHWVAQSNLDLLLPPCDVSVFFCYKKPAGGDFLFTFGSMVGVLKKALAKALVSYYAFAGKIVQNTVGEPELLCNNRGVDFVEAFADVRLQDLNLYNLEESIEGKLVPKKKHGVLSVQATELSCGGVVVACTFDHRVADAYSANMFLVSWAEMAQAKQLSLLPSFRRSLLNPRRPGFYDPSLDDMYVTISALPPPPKNHQPDPDNHLFSRIYYIEADQLSRLQALADGGMLGRKTTKLKAFSAFLWKVVAAGEAEKDKICRMGIVVDGRTRLSDGDSEKLKLMKAYFGNALSIPFGKNKAGDLQERPLSWVAEAVHQFLETAVTKDHFLDLIDWVEAHRPEPALAKIYACCGGDGPDFVVSSGQRFPAAKVDFGWGTPAFGSYHFPWDGKTGYVMPMSSSAGNGDWIVYMHMTKGQLQLIETVAADVIRPLTCDYYLPLAG